MRRLLPLAILALGSVAAAQSPLGSPAAIRLEIAGADPAPDSPGATRLAVGMRALEAGRTADALRAMLAALELHPSSPAILRAMLRATSGDDEARAVFGVWLTLATLDARGRPQADRADRDLLLPKDPWPGRIAQAQFAAFDEVVRELTKLESKGRNAIGNGLVARWLADLAIELGRDAPAALAERAPEIDEALARQVADHGAVFATLRKVFGSRPVGTSSGAEGRAAAELQGIDRAIRAARIALGLAAQVGFDDDLYGPPPPDLGSLPRDASEAIAALRRDVEARSGEPWTVDRLKVLTDVEREEFTRAHATWADPGIAISPNGRYRIETVCGFETLLGAAATVESHHARLVDWFGSDPFKTRPGLVRIEPEHTGLESDGTPFWWAGGFQGGDVTTLRFAWSSIPELGRGLTHELTHRFDGTLFPFLPSWAVEGRAVWTGASYGAITDPEFADELVRPWTIQTPFVNGYGGVQKLTKLLDGTIDDYRDNYTAGYALFTYLRIWRGDGTEPLFAGRLAKFLRNARGGRSDPVAYFTDSFADGKDGRPEGLEAFADGFREFLHGCYRWCWNEKDAQNAWLARHQVELSVDKGYSRLVLDAPSLSWARDRAEPWFGQGHADVAARLFGECGDPRAAAAAGCWSLLVDGWEGERCERVARDLDSISRRDAAWVAREEAARRFSALTAPSGRPPIAGRLTRLAKLCATLELAVADHAANNRPLAAAAFAERQRRIATRVGLAPLALAAPAQSTSLLPRREPPHVLGAFGWMEDGLTGYEERRVPDLWFETETGDMHVGRSRPRDETGLTDRAAHQRHAFVRSSEWLAPGRYVVRARIHFTTSFVSGAMIVGYTRRDRNVRIGFSAGDFLYSIGRKEDDGKTRSVQLSLDGTWEREGWDRMPGANPRKGIEFERPSSFIDIEVHVDGPTLEVFAMGESKFRYTTVDLSPIEGSIGFAMGQGAVRVQAPTVQRLDRGALEAPPSGANTFDELVQRQLPTVPLFPHGTLVLWAPPLEDQEYLGNHVAHWFRVLSKAMRNTLDYPQPWVLMVSPSTTAETIAVMQKAARSVLGAELPVARHVRTAPPEEDVWILFVDSRGVLRVAESGGETAMPRGVEVWARRYRAPID